MSAMCIRPAYNFHDAVILYASNNGVVWRPLNVVTVYVALLIQSMDIIMYAFAFFDQENNCCRAAWNRYSNHRHGLLFFLSHTAIAVDEVVIFLPICKMDDLYISHDGAVT